MAMTLNIMLCVTAPLIVMFFMLSDKSIRRVLLFLMFGMLACFIAGYANEFAGQLQGLTNIEVILFTAPVLEECLKAIPIVIYFLVFKPDFKTLLSAAISCGVGFATLESVIYLVDGMSIPVKILLRGFSTGIMHAMTTSLLAASLWYVTQNGLTRSRFISIMCGFGIIAGGITLHGCYNMLINCSGTIQYIGYIIPIVIAALYVASLFIMDIMEKRTA